MTTKRKFFVLDTNVILHDYNCVYSFQNSDVILPITVLEELDQFKKGHQQIHYNAREFIRILDGLPGDKMIRSGAALGKGGTRIRIMTQHLHEKELETVFTGSKADHRILSVAFFLARAEKNRRVVLVSKDVNMRLKARSLGIIAQDYLSDSIGDVRDLYTGKRALEDVHAPLIDRLYSEAEGLLPGEMGLSDARPNEYFILRNGRKSALACNEAISGRIRRVEVQPAYGIRPRNAEQTFALHALCHPEVQLATLSGKAGTGKTLLALAAALEVRRGFRQVFLARPIIPLSNRDLGYLPGDLETKMDPFMQPLFDNLAVIRHQYGEAEEANRRIGHMLDTGKLSIAPLSYIRGRSLERIYFIVDEAQNLTPHEVKTIITRAGEGTKVVFVGDPFQIDTPYLDARSNGLTYLIERMKGQKLYAHVMLEKGERSPLAELASNLL
ncbi:MAG: PhoH family protein [Candidatus Aminicenantes bacterium]|nr:PhoH family protein [Candidatus Aminicenantes bacterium]